MLEQLRALGPSVMRTVPSWILGQVAVFLGARFNVEWTPGPQETAIVATLVGIVWYTTFRFLEEKVSPKWGWLLGMPGAPSYPPAAPPAPPAPAPVTDAPVVPAAPAPIGDPGA